MEQSQQQNLKQQALEQWREGEFHSLVDIGDIVIPEELTGKERMDELFRQIKNPYLYRCHDLIVHSVYMEAGPTLEERLAQFKRMEGPGYRL